MKVGAEGRNKFASIFRMDKTKVREMRRVNRREKYAANEISNEKKKKKKKRATQHELSITVTARLAAILTRSLLHCHVARY